MSDPTPARQGGSGTDVADDAPREEDVVEREAARPDAEQVTLTEEDGARSGASSTAEPESGPESGAESGAESGPVIRDKRRLDPQTGQVRAAYAATDPAAEDAAGATVDPVDLAGPAEEAGAPAAEGAEHRAALEAARAQADERLLDLQRLQAEYVNYRRRVDRDRDVARETGVASVLEALLPVLDDVHLARTHGDLEGGPFAAIAEKLESTLARIGLVRYGEPGEVFDPSVHEALMHVEAELAEGTTESTVVQILQPGYRSGERILRAARVAVADPR
jgi:molecular chaperone GrpE